MPAHFARIRIAGFKSFADVTSIEIFPGLTGVVGPNGCGKSNVVDALRWAMGEASAKSMRGDEMDDVIFAGSLSRPARNAAEVSIWLTETAGLAPLPFQAEAELQITRKIERGSGSTYRVNGRETRARDVATLFADLASGARNSAMISQGRVSALVNARPDERRAILEEAAGITGLHARRHEAEIKLRSAEQNLTRAEDLRLQQEARLADLHKQARQANRYRKISGAIRDAEIEYLATERHIAEIRRREAQIALQSAQADVTAAQIDCNSAHASERDLTDIVPALRGRESESRTTLERARIHFEQIEAEVGRVRAARAEAEGRLETVIRDLQHAERAGVDAEAAKSRLLEEQTSLEADRLSAPSRLAAATIAAEQAAAALQAAEGAAQTAAEATAHFAATEQAVRTRLKLARDKVSTTRDRLTQATTAHQRAVTELVIPDRLAKLIAERDQAEALSAAIEAAQIERQTAVGNAETARIEAAGHAAMVRAAALDADASMTRLQIEVDALTALLAQEFGHETDPVLDQLKVPAGLETALGAVLRDDLAASVRPEAARHWRCLTPISTHSALPSLGARVEAPDALRRALDYVLVLPDDADGDSLQPSLCPGQTLVSTTGSVWRWDGFVARAGAPSEAGIRLAQRNRLHRLSDDLAAATLTATQRTRDRVAAEANEQAARQAEEFARSQRKSTEAQLDRARATARSLAEATSRLTAEAERNAAREASAAELRTRLEAEHLDALAAQTAAQAEFDALGDVAAISAHRDHSRAVVAQARKTDANARQDVQRMITDAEQRDRRLVVIGREAADWAERARDARFRIIDLTARLHDARVALASIPSDTDAIDARDKSRRALEVAKADHKNATAALSTGEQRVQAVAAGVRHAEQRLAASREGLINAEALMREANVAWGTVAERILERLGAEPILPTVADPTTQAAERARKRIERLTRERDELGLVNLRAEIEVAEIETRLAAIEGDRDEITSAIVKLRSSIGHLNREGRERLSSVFTEVDRHFQSLFTRMFGGGRAHLALTGSDDPLEAGLEIFAEPPGKKLATLSLLSGGEQALTALSLIFAVFRCNPAPISVLDEVDAPLDDANVDRFCTLLDDMARETGTRFLVVTHHHLTMARMDRLYGVTMQERGISRVLSVDLGTATAMVKQPNAIAAE
ncbi:chromosome segregation protein SMC [Acidiphilium sp.]|uniref:chromosome segregation protein SMC n=1 Tax=Acidiphilium sp. TaxID=527 RepID=UPI003D0890D3